MKKKTEETMNEQEMEINEVSAESTEQSADEQEIKIAELTDRLMRNQAEFDNYRRRTQKEKEDLSSYTKCLILGQFLPILDNFERALAAADSADENSLLQGVEMIYRQFWETLEKQGIKKVDTNACPFDPQHHEAIMREAVEGVAEGIVVQELQAGYKLGDQVIRPAMVKVSG